MTAEPERLDAEQLIGLLDDWAGQPVALRVVSSDGDLLAVWHAVLGERTAAKQPASFWPLTPLDPGHAAHAELPGLYVHPPQLVEARLHTDPTVLDIEHGRTRVSLRRL